MSILITGAAGFIGSNLAASLLESGFRVIGVDNLSRGSNLNLEGVLSHPKFSFEKVDLSIFEEILSVFEHLASKGEPISEVWHLAANSDIPAGIADSTIDLRDTFMSTFNLLRAMSLHNVSVLAFASSSAVYGDKGDKAITELEGPLLPLSNYGAMKLASEAAISAWTEAVSGRRCFIFRFPNVVGTPATHGVILDFVRKLKASGGRMLQVLGNGTQRKEYLHVSDLVSAMVHVRRNDAERLSLFNIGVGDGGCSVRFIAEEVVSALSPSAEINFGTENRGWVGDVPKFRYSIEKLQGIGFSPLLTSQEAVRRSVLEIITQEERGT